MKEVPQPKIKKAPLPSPPPKAVAKEVPQPKVLKATVPPAAFQRLRPQGSRLTAPVQEWLPLIRHQKPRRDLPQLHPRRALLSSIRSASRTC